MHYHKVFGFTISSELPLPELISIEKTSNPDVQVKLGEVVRPEDNDPETTYYPHIIFNPKFFFLELPDKFKFFVLKEEEHTQVTVDLIDPLFENDMYAYFYGSAVTAILQLNNTFALHASAVKVNGKLHLFCGHSGMGKSTLAAQLNTRGYNIFSDDKCVLNWNEEEGVFYAEPTLQIVRLWDDAHDLLDDNDFINNPSPVINRMNKFQYHIEESVRITEPLPIERINIMRRVKNDIPTPSRVELKGMKKIRLLRVQIHRVAYLEGFQKTRNLMLFLNQLANKVPVYALRKKKDTPILEFVDFVERNLG